ncbi:putative sodium/calcium exchanger protein [Calothrix parasitica NIES-267]|uniref:Putative sodium/calcium exchanger protein n=1 Tax=Calothrix parasitica NIES-267 TaxID=1973488 RepID=A0A1Z4LHH3_9CYAN|nr:putative sodium/calcium exchanger protein [Calothrix parasitica NIES-267]
MLWIQVIICIALVIAVSSKLSQSADMVAEKSGLGRNWVGAILLAGSTSLPELATGVSAVNYLDAPDLAAGGIFGSCLFNLMILAILDIITGGGPLFQQAQVSHGLAAGLGSLMLGVAATGIFLADRGLDPVLGWVGIPSIVLIVVYLVSARLIAKFERRRRSEVLEQESEAYEYEHVKPRKAYLTFALCSLAIIVLGVWLAWLGDEVVKETGLEESFIGSLLLAITTSLPEVAAGIAAVRLDAVDLAISNVFGSNIFNMAILGIYDIVYIKGDFFAKVAQVHIFTAVIAMMMTSLAIVGLIYRATRPSRLYLTYDVLGLIVLYLGGMYIVYLG